MAGLWLILAQLAAPAASAAQPPAPTSARPPDIELRAQVRARELAIEQQGRASARVRAEPSGGERIEVERNLPRGQARYRDLALTVQIDARLAEALALSDEGAPEQTEPPQGDPDR